jgi:hypothetical protein
MRALAAVMMLVVTGNAAADDLAPTPAEAPGFVTMLRQDAVSRAGADLTYFVLDGGDATLLRLDMHGHYVHAASGAGVYAQLPIAFLSDSGESETVLGGAEVGGIYIPQLASDQVGLVLRGGVTLPTVDDSDTALVGLYASFLRPTDIIGQIPQSSWLRLSASPIIRSGQYFARMDAGVDINIYNDDGDNIDPVLLLNFGAGADLGSAAIMVELTTIIVTEETDESITSAAVSVRGTGSVQPYAALLLPIDNDVNSLFDLGILAGVEGRL